MSLVSIKNVSFSYKKKEVFKNLNMDIEDGKWTTIVGSNGTGKTTLTKILTGELTYHGKITLDGCDIKDKYSLVGLLSLEKACLDKLSDEEIKDALNLLKITSSLSDSEKCLIYLNHLLMQNPKVLLIDNLLDEIEFPYKDKIIKRLKKECKNGLTVVNLSQNMEDIQLGDNIIVINNGCNALNITTQDIIHNEKKLKELDMNLPFIIDLSNKLKYYGMVDKPYFNEKELIDAIWK